MIILIFSDSNKKKTKKNLKKIKKWQGLSDGNTCGVGITDVRKHNLISSKKDCMNKLGLTNENENENEKNLHIYENATHICHTFEYKDELFERPEYCFIQSCEFVNNTRMSLILFFYVVFSVPFVYFEVFCYVSESGSYLSFLSVHSSKNTKPKKF